MKEEMKNKIMEVLIFEYEQYKRMYYEQEETIGELKRKYETSHTNSIRDRRRNATLEKKESKELKRLERDKGYLEGKLDKMKGELMAKDGLLKIANERAEK